MLQIENCSKCKSPKVIPQARIIDRADYNVNTDLTIHVYENPEALIFKGASQGTLRARICGECGYVETYIDNPKELYSAYLKAKSKQE
jgi:hypothetical protein